jgi:hypothetical protein
LYSRDGNGVWEEFSRSLLLKGRGVQAVDAAPVAATGILQLSDLGENTFQISNSGPSFNITRINDAVDRMEAGTVIQLEFSGLTSNLTLINSGYLMLAKTGNYQPKEGDWITLHTTGNGTWKEVGRKPLPAPAAYRGHAAVEASTAVTGGNLVLPVTGENSFRLHNTSGSSITISRINDAIRFEGGSMLILQFGTLTSGLTLSNTAYLVLAKTGNYTVATGDWILLSTEGDGVWRELARKPVPVPYASVGLSTLLYATAVTSTYLTVPATGENFFRLDASAAGGTIARINNTTSRLSAGTIITLEFTNVTVPVTIAHSGFINLVGAANYIPAQGALLTLITPGDGTWKELYRRTA